MTKVFGIGLSRTGTQSLTQALNLLGINTIHCPADPTTVGELMGGQYKLTVMNDYQGATDTPIAAFYPQFDKAFPGSKFILTVRERASWLRSNQNHFAKLVRVAPKHPYYRFLSHCCYGIYGFHRGRFLWSYNSHLRNATYYFANRPGDLLVLDICAGEGWEKLCPFLGKPIPDVPFPHENKRGRIKMVKREATQ